MQLYGSSGRVSQGQLGDTRWLIVFSTRRFSPGQDYPYAESPEEAVRGDSSQALGTPSGRQRQPARVRRCVHGYARVADRLGRCPGLTNPVRIRHLLATGQPDDLSHPGRMNR